MPINLSQCQFVFNLFHFFSFGRLFSVPLKKRYARQSMEIYGECVAYLGHYGYEIISRQSADCNLRTHIHTRRCQTKFIACVSEAYNVNQWRVHISRTNNMVWCSLHLRSSMDWKRRVHSVQEMFVWRLSQYFNFRFMLFAFLADTRPDSWSNLLAKSTFVGSNELYSLIIFQIKMGQLSSVHIWNVKWRKGTQN